MYVAGLVMPAPEEEMGAYRELAESGAKIFKDHGCLEIVESWEDFFLMVSKRISGSPWRPGRGIRSSSPGRSGPIRRRSMRRKQRCMRTGD